MSKVSFPTTSWNRCGNTSYYRKERHDARAEIFIDPILKAKVEAQDHGNYYLVTKTILVDLDEERLKALYESAPLEVEVAIGWLDGLETIYGTGAKRRDILRGLDSGHPMWRSGVLEAVETALIGDARPAEVIYEEKIVSKDDAELSDALMEFGVFEC